MKRYRFFYCLLTLIALCSCASAQQVKRYAVGVLTDQRLVFALPQTVLYLEVTSEVTREEPGELALYAERYLGTKSAVMAPALRYSLKEVHIESRGVADERQRFALELRRQSEANYVSLTDDGLLVGINLPNEITLPLPKDMAPTQLQWEKPQAPKFPLEYIQATTKSAKAQILAENIYRIRENRDLVVSGESEQPFADGRALEIAVKRLDEQERAFTQQFEGLRQSQKLTQAVDNIQPTEEGKRVVARFSPREGLLPKEDLRGEPIYLEIEVLEEAPTPDEKEQKKLERRLNKGIPYCVPGLVRATVSYRGQVLTGREVPVAQLGSLEALDMVLFNTKGKTTSVELYPSNGGLKEVKELQ